MKIRAAVLEEFGQPLVVQEVELAEPKAGEVLVRLAACGVCHTDLYTASGADPTGYAPCVLGHEGAGVVERVGEGVTLVAPGDHVDHALRARVRRVRALPQRRARTAASRSATSRDVGYLPDGTTRLSRDGEPLRHFMGTSTFAEYTVMPEIALAKVSPEAPLEGCAPFACGLSTGIGAALYTARVEPGSTCVVFGCGLVGLGAVIGARLAGAERIVAVDLSEERLAEARHHGATDTRVAGDDTVDWIRSETGGFGADYTFEATGNVRGDAPGGRGGPRGVGARDDVRRRRQGRDARHRPAVPDHRPARDGLVVRRRQGPHAGAAARRPLARGRDRRRGARLAPASRSTT